MDTRRIGDELEIAGLLAKYARAVDSEDWELWRSLFTDDATVDYSSAGGITGTRDEVAEWLRVSLAQVPVKQDYITNIEADVSGDTARVRAMFFNPTLLPGMSELSYYGGYYHHVLVRTEAGWRSREFREETVWRVNPMQPRR